MVVMLSYAKLSLNEMTCIALVTIYIWQSTMVEKVVANAWGKNGSRLHIVLCFLSFLCMVSWIFVIPFFSFVLSLNCYFHSSFAFSCCVCRRCGRVLQLALIVFDLIVSISTKHVFVNTWCICVVINQYGGHWTPKVIRMWFNVVWPWAMFCN